MKTKKSRETVQEETTPLVIDIHGRRDKFPFWSKKLHELPGVRRSELYRNREKDRGQGAT